MTDDIPLTGPGSYMRARGVLPREPGEEPAEVRIRRTRDAQDLYRPNDLEQRIEAAIKKALEPLRDEAGGTIAVNLWAPKLTPDTWPAAVRHVISASGLVPLSEVRAIVRTEQSLWHSDGGGICEAPCDAILTALDERFGEKEMK